MRRNRTLHIWVASGNYELIEQVRLAFSAQQATVQPLFSHRDAVYAAIHQTADVLFLDDGMMDRETGMPTGALLRQMPSCPMIIRYRSPHTQPQISDSDDTIVIRSLDPITLQNAYQQAFTDRQTPQPAFEKDAKYETHAGESLLWRSAEIKTLFALSRSLTEVLELGEVLNRVVEAARALTDADEGMILLPDGENRELYLRAKVGIENEVALNFRVKTQDTLAGEVFNSGKPVLIGAQGPLKVKTQYFVNSLLYVPIILKTKVIGVLGVNNKDKYDIFSERDQELLLNLASYAAIAIENARIHGQSIKRARELKSLVDAGQDINASLSVEHTLRSICQQLQRVLNVHSAEILEWDADARTLGTVARQIHAVWRHEAQPTLPLASGSAFVRALGNEVALWLDIRSASDYEGEWLTRMGSSGVWLIPVRVDGQPLALVMGHQTIRREFMADDDRFLRARGYALDALSLLREARGTPTAALNSLDEINDLLQTEWVELAVVRPDVPHQLFVTLATGVVVWTQESAVQPCITLTQYPDVENALYQGTSINVYRVGKIDETDTGRFLSERRGASLLGIPMLGRGQIRRIAIVIDTEHAEAFATREIDLMKAIINQASTALENARLLHDLEISLIELRETQARLIQAARLTAMGELAAAVAHQINNPLTTIVLDTELMLDQPALDTDTRETLIAISNAGKRAAGVVRRLLASIRPQSISNLPAQAVNVLETINGTVSLVRSHIEHSRIRLTTALPETLPPVFAIPGELDDIWLNLLLNAHDALAGQTRAGVALESGQKDEIGIWAQHDPEAGVIEIQIYDNGPGIPETIIDEIFKPFFTTKPPGEGTGLGLHICRQTVEHVGGQMTVHSIVDQGTTFVVRLPITGRNDR